jgi:hypothetical protein
MYLVCESIRRFAERLSLAAWESPRAIPESTHQSKDQDPDLSSKNALPGPIICQAFRC